jgi:hypothetical protein
VDHSDRARAYHGGGGTVIRYRFTDIEELPDWWLVVKGDELDLWVKDPGKEVDVYFTSSVRTMAAIWMGENTYRKAVSQGALACNITSRMANSIFADLRPAKEI